MTNAFQTGSEMRLYAGFASFPLFFAQMPKGFEDISKK